ncbi:MAG: succinate dehydrogenase/fumarate reductase iron-sulfur subunit [Anaerolineae bacterium]|nr:succinate dehydrogenase/fumarate reductase iron-sulfur subunit [Anaerolineae bacterium]
MMWTITLKIARYKPGEPARTDTFQVSIDPERTVLDSIEKIWAEQDRSLVFRHACHHASCGSCAMVVNGVEILPCIKLIKDVTKPGGTLIIEPLHNFPVISDLVVDMGPFFERMQIVKMPIVGPADPLPNQEPNEYNRFDDCIECGMCLSACPVVATDSKYLGPAALAAAYQILSSGDGNLSAQAWEAVDGEHGLWRCHVAFECSAVCPSNVDPAGKIMALRRRMTVERIRHLLGLGSSKKKREK